MNLIDAKTAIKVYTECDIPCFLWGPPGVGKSDAVRQVADDLGELPVIDFRAILRDPVDLRGLPSIDHKNNVAKWLPPDDLPNEKRDGKEGILFLDELNAAPQSVQAACFGLVLDRKVGDYHLPKGWRVIAAGNRQSDRAAAQRVPSALANRFAHIDVEPDIDAFTDWATRNDISSEVVAFLRYRPALLHDMKSQDGKDLIAFPTPRAWANVSKIVDAKPDQSLRLKLVQGLVGLGAVTEFESFMRIISKLPSLDSIILSPTKVDIPTEPAARYAVASGLARKATKQNIGNIILYAARMPKEFEVMLVQEATRRDPLVGQHKSFIDWMQKNQHVILG